VHISAVCTLHLALCSKLVLCYCFFVTVGGQLRWALCLSGNPSLCVSMLSVLQLYCCIVENKPSLSLIDVSRSCHYHIRALHHVRPLLTLDTAKAMAVAVIGRRLDYCNSVLYGMSQVNINRLLACAEHFGAGCGTGTLDS